MEIFHWFLASNLVWLIMIATMIKIKASWSAIIVVAIIINALGFASTPISYYVAICINLLFPEQPGYLLGLKIKYSFQG